jgi:hypothetical protein
MLRILSDEDLNGRIVRAMRRMEPNLDLVRVQEERQRNYLPPRAVNW